MAGKKRRSIPDVWGVQDVAKHLGVAPSTVSSYLARAQMPAPDFRVLGRPGWWPDTIKAWRPAADSTPADSTPAGG